MLLKFMILFFFLRSKVSWKKKSEDETQESVASTPEGMLEEFGPTVCVGCNYWTRRSR